jgi:aquaporin Z
MKIYWAEFFGTFGIVFFGCGAIILNDVSNGMVTHFGISVTFGVIVTLMILVFGKISGAHLNPAVTLGFSYLHLFKKELILKYFAAQILGGLAAAFLLKLIFSTHQTLGNTIPSGNCWISFCLEFLLTFILMMVILITSQSKKYLQKFTPYLVGLTVGVEAYFAGPICGASMNPARSIAPSIASGNINFVWLYITAPIFGGLLASFIYKKLTSF